MKLYPGSEHPVGKRLDFVIVRAIHTGVAVWFVCASLGHPFTAALRNCAIGMVAGVGVSLLHLIGLLIAFMARVRRIRKMRL